MTTILYIAKNKLFCLIKLKGRFYLNRQNILCGFNMSEKILVSISKFTNSQNFKQIHSIQIQILASLFNIFTYITWVLLTEVLLPRK